MKFKYLTFLVFVSAICFSIVSCDKEPDPVDCDTEGLTYTNFAENLLSTNCSSPACHGAGTMTTFEMTDYASTKIAVDFNRMIGAINHEANFTAMPLGGTKLDDCSISKLTQWINDGAPE